MGNNGGDWIKLYRQLIDKAIWQTSTAEQKVVLVTILLLASYTHNEWAWAGQEFEVLPGQFVTSLEALQKAAGKGVSIRNVRTALKRFEKLGFLTNKSTKTGRLITVLNWGSYQSINREPDKASDKQVTNRRQRPDKQVTPIKKVRKQESEKVRKRNPTLSCGEAVEVLDYLNMKTGKAFRRTDEIEARLNAGGTVQECKMIIDNQLSDIYFQENPKFLNPVTLFRKTHFDLYLNNVPHPLRGLMSDVSIRNVESFSNWKPPEERDRDHAG